MPHQVHPIIDLGAVVVRFSGRIDYQELQDVLDELPLLPDFRPHLKLIADFRDCATTMTGQEVQKLAAYARRSDASWGETRWALLAPDDVIFGLSRMYMALTEDYQVETHVFRSVDETDDWLGLGVGLEEALRHAA